MRMFSPVFAASSWRSSSIVFESCFSALTCCWSSSATSEAHLLQLALDDFLDDVVRFAFFFRLLFEDALFGLAGLGVDFVGRDVLRRGRRDVQGDLVGEDLEVLVAGRRSRSRTAPRPSRRRCRWRGCRRRRRPRWCRGPRAWRRRPGPSRAAARSPGRRPRRPRPARLCCPSSRPRCGPGALSRRRR